MEYKESETLELKKSTSELKEAVISIVAMLNKHGKGMLYLGIKDDGTVIGQLPTLVSRRSKHLPLHQDLSMIRRVMFFPN